MTIDKEQLISLLIDKTGLDREQVENQLSELINRIQQAAKEGKTFEVEGFGVFSIKEGNLQFEPHDTLETEINNKYAGMKPIELIGAFKEPEGDEVPEVPEEMSEEGGRWSFDESALEKEEAPLGKETKESEEDFDQVFESEEKEESAAPIRQELVAQDKTTVESEKEETDPLGRILVAAVIVIALGVGGWFVYDIGFSENTTEPMRLQQAKVPTQKTQDTQQEPVDEVASSKKSADHNESEPEQEMKVTNPEGSSEKTESQQQSKFGLRGKVNQSAGGYTIVIHSFRNTRKAATNRQDLENTGFRALVNKAIVDGRTYYRVGIGQFESVSDAQQAMRELPQRYRENNFIKRIK